MGLQEPPRRARSDDHLRVQIEQMAREGRSEREILRAIGAERAQGTFTRGVHTVRRFLRAA